MQLQGQNSMATLILHICVNLIINTSRRLMCMAKRMETEKLIQLMQGEFLVTEEVGEECVATLGTASSPYKPHGSLPNERKTSSYPHLNETYHREKVISLK